MCPRRQTCRITNQNYFGAWLQREDTKCATHCDTLFSSWWDINPTTEDVVFLEASRRNPLRPAAQQAAAQLKATPLPVAGQPRSCSVQNRKGSTMLPLVSCQVSHLTGGEAHSNSSTPYCCSPSSNIAFEVTVPHRTCACISYSLALLTNCMKNTGASSSLSPVMARVTILLNSSSSVLQAPWLCCILV